MDTNSNIPAQKKVVSVEILHLNTKGYGPWGSHTRSEWRRECFEKLKSGASLFRIWQEGLVDIENFHYRIADLDFNLVHEDGTRTRQFVEPSNVLMLDFCGHAFNSSLFASDYEFLHTANFHSAIFNEGVLLDNSNFNQAAVFTNATFKGNVKFDNTIFNEDAHFGGTLFEKLAQFSNVKFKNVAFFSNAEFQGDTSFIKATFMSLSLFNENFKMDSKAAVFKNNVSFESAVFSTVGHFEGVRFEKRIPSFLGVDNAATRLEFSEDEFFSKTDVTEDAVKRIGQLKRLADEQGQTDQALMFNKFELNAKRAQARIKTKQLNFLQKLGNSDFWFANATASYDIFSSYGRSFTKPLKYYFGLLLVVYILALGNAVVNSPKSCKAENLRILSDLLRDDTPCDISKTNPDDKTRLNGYRAAAEYTVYRAAGILDFSDNGKGTDAVARRLFGQSYEPGWMRFVGLVKAIASTALLFLAALGLRNKYRIK